MNPIVIETPNPTINTFLPRHLIRQTNRYIDTSHS